MEIFNSFVGIHFGKESTCIDRGWEDCTSGEAKKNEWGYGRCIQEESWWETRSNEKTSERWRNQIREGKEDARGGKGKLDSILLFPIIRLEPE